MTNWEWPQYLLATYWGITPVILILLMLAQVKLGYQKCAWRIVDISALAWILYMGGFWS